MTFEEKLQELPMRYVDLALKYLRNDLRGQEAPNSPIVAISIAFDWKGTEEGHAFWRQAVYELIIDMKATNRVNDLVRSTLPPK